MKKERLILKKNVITKLTRSQKHVIKGGVDGDGDGTDSIVDDKDDGKDCWIWSVW